MLFSFSLVILFFVAVFLYVLFGVIKMRMIASKLEKQGYVVKRSFMGANMLTLLVDIVFPEWFSQVVSPYFEVSAQRLLNQCCAIMSEKDVDIIAIVSFIPDRVELLCRDANFSHESFSNANVDKHIEVYGVLNQFGRNIVTTNGDEWKRHRQVCSVAFSKSNLRLVRSSTVKHVTDMLDHWIGKSKDGGKSTEVVFGGEDDFMRLTFGVFGDAIFGHKMENMFQSMDGFSEHLMHSASNVHVFLGVPKWLMRWPFEGLRKLRDSFSSVQSEMKVMLKEALSEEFQERRDLLSLLSRANQRFDPLSEGESLADVWMFCVAGMETSAHTLGWAVMEMSFNEEVQRKVYEESVAFGEAGRSFDEVSPETAPYTVAVVHETLRLHPAVSIIPLKCRQATTIAGRPVENGYGISIHADSLHANPKYFDNPQSFRPERYITEDGKFSLKETPFFAFSEGMRACIGKHVALAELAVALSMIVNRFKIGAVRSYEECSRSVYKLTREFKYPTPFKFIQR